MKSIKRVQALTARLPMVLFVSLALAAGSAPRADAATTVGEISPTYEYAQCGGAITVETAVPAAARPYVIPAAGVITSWSTATANSAGTAKLKVLRPTGAKEYLVVGEDGPHSVAAGTTPTFSGARVPVQAGDVVALLAKGTNCMAWFPGNPYAYSALTFGLDPPPGGSASAVGFGQEFAIAVSATVEPDADDDGYGDETQDACPGDATDHTLPCGPEPGPAPAPPPGAADSGGSADSGGASSGGATGTGGPPPRLELSGPSRQAALRAGAVLEVATVDVAATVRATGSIEIAGSRAALALRPTTATSPAGTGTLLRLRVPAKTGRKLRAALRHGRRVTASVRVTAVDASANSSQATQTVAIRGGRRGS